MEYRIEVSYQAENDFTNIMDYMSFTLSNPKAASIFHDESKKKIDLLYENPYLYEEIAGRYFEKIGFRKIPINNFLVIYSVEENKKMIKIMRLFSQKQNYLKYL